MQQPRKFWVILAVDPGSSMTCAALDFGNVLSFYDAGRVTTEGRNDAKKLARIVEGLIDDVGGPHNVFVICEKVFIRPGENLSTGVPFIGSQFLVAGVAAALGVRFDNVSPSVWKQQLRVPGKSTKGANSLICDRAAETFGNRSLFVPPSRMHNRADAALLAEWHRRKLVAAGEISNAG